MPSESRSNPPDNHPAGRELEREAEIDSLQEVFASAVSSLRASFVSAVSQISSFVSPSEYDHHYDSLPPHRQPNIPRPLIPPPITGKAYVPKWDTTRINTKSNEPKMPAKSGQSPKTTTKSIPTKREKRKGEDEDIDESCATLEKFGRRCGQSPPKALHRPCAQEVAKRSGEWALDGLSVFDDSGDEEVYSASFATDRVVSRLRREARESLLGRSDEEDMSW